MTSVLVIDDDAQVRAFVREVLEPEGYEVRQAGNGAEGIEAYRRRPADLILCDLFMPDKEGLETIREFRDGFPRVKVLAMSGGSALLGQVDFLPLALKFGAVAALDKPLTPRALTTAVREALRS